MKNLHFFGWFADTVNSRVSQSLAKMKEPPATIDTELCCESGEMLAYRDSHWFSPTNSLEMINPEFLLA